MAGAEQILSATDGAAARQRAVALFRRTRRPISCGVIALAGCAVLLSACSTVLQHLPKSYSSCECYDDAYNGNRQPVMLEHQWKL